jgi:exportin-1
MCACRICCTVQSLVMLWCAIAVFTLQEQLMQLPNDTWGRCMEMAAANEEALGVLQVQQQLYNVLLSNVSVCQSLGGFFLPQMVRLYSHMLGVYGKYSVLINSSIQQAGPLGAQQSAIKSMRSIKKATLKLIETFVETSDSEEHLQVISQQFVPMLMEPILSDYDKSLADAKCDLLLTLPLLAAALHESRCRHPLLSNMHGAAVGSAGVAAWSNS